MKTYSEISLAAYSETIARCGDLGEAVLAHFKGNLEDAYEALENHYYGEYGSEEDYAREYVNDCYDPDDSLKLCIDYKKLTKLLFEESYYSIKVNDECHVFSTF